MRIQSRHDLAAALVYVAVATSIHAQSSAFTYQGQFTENGEPFTGQVEFQFTLWDAGTNGSQIAATDPEDTVVPVTNGLFAVPLDFGAEAFDGTDRWLEIKARTTIGEFTTLAPRQPLTPAPYALRALSVNSNGLSDGTYANAVTFNNPANLFNGSFEGTLSGDGAGVTNVNAETLQGLDASAFWQVGGNAGTTAGVNFLGTTDDQPLELFVNHQRVLRFENNGDGSDTNTIPDGAPNVIGGSPANFVAADVVGATIAGGGAMNRDGTAHTNSVLADYGSVLGGIGNTASGYASTAMGDGTTAGSYASTATGSGTAASGYASTAMGDGTTANGGWSTAMGRNSTASGRFSTTMGDGTTASGLVSTAMGDGTTASGFASTAIGYRAKATHDGSFVWADSQLGDFASTAQNEFSVRAQNGLRIVNQGNGALLLHLATDRPWGFRQLGTGSTSALELYNFSVNKNFIINTTGNVGIGTTAPAFTLHVDGSAGKPGGGSWSTASDARLKDVGRRFTRGLEALEKIQPRHYHYAADNALDLPSEPDYVGLIAQQVQTCIPEAVERNATGYLHLNNDPILWTMLNGIKELNQKVDERGNRLQRELKRRDAENGELKRELDELKELVQSLLPTPNGGAK